MELSLKIDPEFQSKIPPLTEAEYTQLEENILEIGEVREPIIVWNGTIVDGHNRYAIIMKHPEVKWTFREMSFRDKWEAFDWMYKNQLGRRNLTEQQKDYLIGKRYEAQKHTGAPIGNQNATKQGGQNVQVVSRREIKDGTAGKIGEEYGITSRSVRRDEEFAHGIDAIRTEDPEFADSILTASTKVKKSHVREIGKARPEELHQLVEAVKSGEKNIEREKRHTGASKANRKECAEIRDVIETLTDDTVMDYTIDHLTDQISENADAFIRMLSNMIMDHADVCNENVDRVIRVIDESVIKRIEQIKERLNNGTQL